MSKRFTLSQTQIESLKRAFIKYFLPLVLIFLVAIQEGIEIEKALYLVYAGGLQMLINFLTKFLSENKE